MHGIPGLGPPADSVGGPPSDHCDGACLRQIVAGGVQLLARRSARINNLNVFPVPDGDTGTNMLLTLRAAAKAADGQEAGGIADVAAAVARGALMGARGNSGVILSQYLRGLARGLEGQASVDGATLARALGNAADAAVAAVSEPAEGTMLTVGRDAARAAGQAAESGAGVVGVLATAVEEARASVERTRELLPVLREANVVDAGGLGLETILEGMCLVLRGEPIPDNEPQVLDAPAAAHLAPDVYGFCTEFLIHGDGLDAAVIRARLSEQGDSLLVVGDATLVRVHLHTFAPGRAIDTALVHGAVDQIKIENMQQQNRQLRACGPTPTVTSACALVVVASGDGFRELFHSLGAGALVPGGQTLNPSAEEILQGVGATSGRECVVLPNNPNVLLAAQQARALADRPVAIVATRNLAEGVAAALAFDPGQTAADNVAAMDRARRDVRSAEVTTAIRSAKIDGRAIQPGAVLGLVDDRIEVIGTDRERVVVETLEKIAAGDAEVITLYVGQDVAADEMRAVQERVRAAFPGRQVDLVAGGQPLYPYLLACE